MPPAVLSEPTQVAAPIRVILADDSAAIRTLARHALSVRHGFEVTEAVDGVEVLDIIDTVKPDCVVLDIQMPRMGGFEVLAELRQRSPDLPVILLSGESGDEIVDEACNRGASSYVNKITSLASLADAVRRVALGGVAEAGAAGSAAPSPSEPAGSRSGMLPTVVAASTTDIPAELRRLEYVVSHDLGEPLRIMSGFAGLMESRYADVLDASGRTFLGHIADAATRMQRMLDDLLAYSRGGRAEPTIAPIDLNQLMGRVVASFGTEIAGRDGEVRVGNLPFALGDATMLVTVMRLILDNALRFNQSDRPIVSIEGSADDSTAVLTMHDNGIGVPEADRERVFGLFVRLNSREAYPGTGTGLALCRRLMTAQGGSISLDGSADDGTTVTLRLPTAGQSPTPKSGSHDGTD